MRTRRVLSRPDAIGCPSNGTELWPIICEDDKCHARIRLVRPKRIFGRGKSFLAFVGIKDIMMFEMSPTRSLLLLSLRWNDGVWLEMRLAGEACEHAPEATRLELGASQVAGRVLALSVATAVRHYEGRCLGCEILLSPCIGG